MIKKTLLTLAFLSITQFSNATGIPTVDVAGIAQMVANNAARAADFAKTLSEAQKRLEQLKQTANHYKSMVEGHHSFEDVLQMANANNGFAFNNWQDIYNDTSELEQLREDFNMYSDDPEIQKRFDQELLSYKAQRNYYNGTVARNNRMQTLLNQFSTATTPGLKADLANAINFEQLQIRNDAQMMDTLNKLMEKQKSLESEQLAETNIQNALRSGLIYKDE